MSLNYHFLLPLSILLFTQATLLASAMKPPVWEGSVHVEFDVPPEKSWPFLADFCNVYKIYPVTVSFCDNKGGPQHVKPGDRRLTGKLMNGTDEVQFEEHRLLKIDTAKRYITYKMGANSLGVTYYQVTVSVMPSKKIENGSVMIWKYKVKPVMGYDPMIFNHVLQSLVNPVPPNIHKWLHA